MASGYEALAHFRLREEAKASNVRKLQDLMSLRRRARILGSASRHAFTRLAVTAHLEPVNPCHFVRPQRREPRLRRGQAALVQ